jgi:glycosyltransferase involved in cell wall biosynthesis
VKRYHGHFLKHIAAFKDYFAYLFEQKFNLIYNLMTLCPELSDSRQIFTGNNFHRGFGKKLSKMRMRYRIRIQGCTGEGKGDRLWSLAVVV